MEEEVKKWLEKKLVGIKSSPEEFSKPAEVVNEPEKTDSRPQTEEVIVEDEITKSIESQQKPPVPESPAPEIKKVVPEVKEATSEVKEPAVQIPKMKENLDADIDISKTYYKEKPESLPEKAPRFTTKSKVLMILIVVLVAFLVSWFVFFFPR